MENTSFSDSSGKASESPGNKSIFPGAEELSEEEKKILEDLIQPKVYMQWLTPAYRQTEKSKGWYVVMGLIVLIFVIYGMFSGDSYGWIVSITFLIMAGVLYLNELKPAPAVKVIINQLGIKYGARFFPYHQLKSFWILNEENARHLNLILRKSPLRPFTVLVPDEINIARVRDQLLLQIPEEEGQEESFVDTFIRNLGL